MQSETIRFQDGRGVMRAGIVIGLPWPGAVKVQQAAEDPTPAYFDTGKLAVFIVPATRAWRAAR